MLPNLDLVQGKEGRISTFTFNPKLNSTEEEDENPARSLAGNPDSPQAVVFETSIIDVTVGS